MGCLSGISVCCQNIQTACSTNICIHDRLHYFHAFVRLVFFYSSTKCCFLALYKRISRTYAHLKKLSTIKWYIQTSKQDLKESLWLENIILTLLVFVCSNVCFHSFTLVSDVSSVHFEHLILCLPLLPLIPISWEFYYLAEGV